MRLTGGQVAEQVQLTQIVILVLVLAILILEINHGQLLISKNTNGEVFEVRRSQIFHLVSLLIIVQLRPSRLSSCWHIFNIDVVSVHVVRQHGLSIDVQHHKVRVLEVVCGYTASYSCHEKGLFRIGHAVAQLVAFFVGMASQTKPYNILEALY